MRWTKPKTAEQIRYYSKFSGVLKRLTNTRIGMQYCLWMPLSAWAMAMLIQAGLSQFFQIHILVLLPITLLVTYLLHLLLSEEYTTHFYDKWDDNPDTNSGIWFSIVLAAFLGGLEFFSTGKFFQSQVVEPVAKSTTVQDSIYGTFVAAAVQEYTQTKDAIEETFNQTAMLTAPTLFNEIEVWKNKKAKNWKDRNWIRSKSEEAERRLSNQPGLVKLRQTTATRLDSLLTDHQAELARLKRERNMNVNVFRQRNEEDRADYEIKMQAAWHYGGIISIISLVVFLYCARREVRIKTKSGIFPLRSYTDLQAHGGAWEKLTIVFSDVVTRRVHRWLQQFHERQSKRIGTLKGLDGKIILEDGNYQPTLPEQKKLNGHHIDFELGKKPQPHQN